MFLAYLLDNDENEQSLNVSRSKTSSLNIARETEEAFEAHGTPDDAQDAEWREMRRRAALRCRHGGPAQPSHRPTHAAIPSPRHIASQ